MHVQHGFCKIACINLNILCSDIDAKIKKWLYATNQLHVLMQTTGRCCLLPYIRQLKGRHGHTIDDAQGASGLTGAVPVQSLTGV